MKCENNVSEHQVVKKKKCEIIFLFENDELNLLFEKHCIGFNADVV